MSSPDKIYGVNIKRLALLVLPTWLRRKLVGTLMYSGVVPLGRLIGELRTFRETTTYRLTHNGQVCKLRGVLNDKFDPTHRRIKIEDGGETEWSGSTIWQREQERWLMIPRRGLGATTMHRNGFGGSGGYDFWVVVPYGLLDDNGEARLRALINMYKLASKRYALNYKQQ